MHGLHGADPKALGWVYSINVPLHVLCTYISGWWGWVGWDWALNPHSWVQLRRHMYWYCT